MRSSGKRNAVRVLLLLAVAGGIYYFFFRGPDKKDAPAPQTVPVKVETIQSQPTQVWTEFSGRLHPVNAAEIRPEVSGRITRVMFEDGQMVKRGDTLFVIDPGPYEAAVAKAEADLAAAKSTASFATVEQRRAASMLKTQAIAKRVLDERVNATAVAGANIKVAQAALKQARIDLDHAYVKAPISGRVGRVELTIGNVVQPGPTAPLLTTVVSSDGIYADFEVDEQTYLRSIRNGASNRMQERKIPVKLQLQGDDKPYDGTIYSFDNQLNVGSGTIRARARFTNADGALLPGMFVTVRMAGSAEREALLVPEKAIGFDQSKKFVMVADTDNKAAYHEITVGDKLGDRRIVLSGLQSGDRVIVDGVQHVRPGAPVQATEVGSEAAQPAAGAKPDAPTEEKAKD